jgi:transposase
VFAKVDPNERRMVHDGLPLRLAPKLLPKHSVALAVLAVDVKAQLTEFFATYASCTVVMEACAGSHFMARKLSTFGHEVRLISPQFVRPFVKSNKNDFVDAEAICEAASRPAMRFVPPKTESQQTLSVLHRVRESTVWIPYGIGSFRKSR